MRRSRIGWIALTAIALLVAPAFAAPSPSETVTWRVAGVSEDNPSLNGEIIGGQIRCSGEATRDASGFWSGTGTIVDRRGTIRADLAVSDVTYLSPDQVYITGENAVVTAAGVTYTYRDFGLTLDRSTSEFELYIQQNIGSVWSWWIPGTAFKGSIRIT